MLVPISSRIIIEEVVKAAEKIRTAQNRQTLDPIFHVSKDL